MPAYNFDKIIDRSHTSCIKYDARAKIFGAEDVTPLWVADMDFEVAPEIAEAIENRAQHHVYGYTMRCPEYYAITQQWIKRRYKWDVEEKDISYSPGVVSAIVMAMLAFTKPGDKVIVQSPVYFPFFSSIENNGRRILNNTLVPEKGSYKMDFEHLERSIDHHTRMMFLCNPHNPVGRSWTKEELTKLAAIAEKHNLMVVSDEIHADIIFSGHVHTPFATVSGYARENTITCMAPSKTFNLAGLSTSIVVIQNSSVLKIYNQMLDNYHIGLTNPFGLEALKAAYQKGDDWLEALLVYLEGNRDYVYAFINENIKDVDAYLPESTFLMWLDFSKLGLDDRTVQKRLVEDAGVGLSGGAMFGEGGSGFQRLNFGCSRSVLENTMERLATSF
ncbi:MAG: PatB family C-S lyase [Salinivirgaceae bacterium]